jgi:hypothetical protein
MDDDDPERKRRAPAPSRLELLLARVPFYVAVPAAFLLVLALGGLFARGDQIYPPEDPAPPGMDSPECRLLSDATATITERQFRVVYQVRSRQPLARSSAWRLLRVRIAGPAFRQELRSGDHCGLYSLAGERSVVHFELFQEGATRVELLCLDRRVLALEGDVAPWARATPLSIAHRNGDLTNVCLAGGRVVFFARGWVSWHSRAALGDAEFRNGTLAAHAGSGGVADSAFVFNATQRELAAMSEFAVFERLLLPAFLQAQRRDALVLRHALALGPVFARLAQGKLVTGGQVCVRYASVEHREEATAPELEAMRALAVGPANRTAVVVINHCDASAELMRSAPGAFVDLVDFSDREAVIRSVAVAGAMVSFDDGDRVISAFWLPPESPLVVVVPPRRVGLSKALARVAAAGRRIIPVEGEIEGAVSQHPDLFAKCVGGALDPAAEACAPAFAGLVYRVNVTRISDALRTI